jgi:hypothetical protein
MSWLGSPTTIQNSGLSNNAVINLNATFTSVRTPVKLNENFVLDQYNLPNSEVDHVGPQNRIFTVRGVIDSNSPGTNKITVSGLTQLTETGSNASWFYDEGLCQWRNASGLWVRIQNITINRSIDNTKSSHVTGYVLNYDMSLVETIR